MLTDVEMRQAAIANPGRCIYRSWNPSQKFSPWKPMNFHPDNWRKISGDVRKHKVNPPIKTGFDVVEKADPPSGKTPMNFTRPDSWDYNRYGYRISD